MGTLTVSVIDPSGAAIAGATISVSRQDDPTAAPWAVPAQAGGVGAVLRLPAGRFTIRVEAAGFVPATVNVRMTERADLRRTVRLSLAPVAETVVVGRDRQGDAIDPRGFSTFLSREQIDALPDDPESFARALQAMAPPGAVIRIDGFTGGSLPPKSQILSIRIPRLDTFAAQDHGGLSGLSFIELVTRPGGGTLAGSADVAIRHDALNARNPLSPTRGDERTGAGTLAFDGPIVPGAASFSASARASGQRDAAIVSAVLADGTEIAESVMRPQDILTVSGRLTTSLGGNRTLRVSAASDRRSAGNLGVGGTSLPERAYSSVSSETLLRAAAGGPIGRRGLFDVRVQFRRAGSMTQSGVEAPAVHVLDAFSAGGAQTQGGTRLAEMETAADFDYAWRTHAIRAGVLVEHGRYQSRRAVNYLGTYTFTSLADYNAARPASYSRRVGDPSMEFQNWQLGFYVQDDVRVARSLLVGAGVRAEAQPVVGGTPALLPRATLAWSPLGAGTTTVRAGWGAFADWLPVSVYEQSLALDGVRQHDVLVLMPSYPEAAGIEVSAPGERSAIGSDVRLPGSLGMTVGVEQQAAPGVRLYASYSHRRGHALLRGVNLNQPIAGVRPDPLFGNVIETRSDASLRAHTLTLQAVASDPRRRAEVTGVYVFSDSQSNTSGPFVTPASGDRTDTEWGPNAPAHVAAATLTLRLPLGVTITMTPRWRSGTPYTITTGRDDNRDGLFNDRPPGVARNSAQTPAQWEVGARVAFVTRFGAGEPPGLPSAGGDPQSLRAGAVARGSGDAAQAARVRLEIFVSAENVTNHPNYAAIGSVVGSPFFGRPMAATRPRTIELGARVGF